MSKLNHLSLKIYFFILLLLVAAAAAVKDLAMKRKHAKGKKKLAL